MVRRPTVLLIVVLLIFGVAISPRPAQAQGTRSCAVSVVDQDIGTGGGRNANNPSAVFGEPQGIRGPFISIGQGGFLTVELSAPGVSGDGTASSDLFVYEAGTQPEFVFVELSADGSTFVPVGRTGSQASGIDLDALGFGPGTSYSFVRVTDDPAQGGQASDTGGADIDAVCGTNLDNAPPVAVDDAETFTVGDAYTTNVLANDTDPDGNELSIEAVTQPAGDVGTVTFDDNGVVMFEPDDPLFSGTVTFSYTVIDGIGGRATATVVFVIESTTEPTTEPEGDPVTTDGSYATDVDEPLDGDLNDVAVDPDGGSLTFEVDDPPDNGTLELDPDGPFTYTPAPGFSGEDSFTYIVTDDEGQTSTGEVSIVVGECVDPSSVDQATTTDTGPESATPVAALPLPVCPEEPVPPQPGAENPQPSTDPAPAGSGAVVGESSTDPAPADDRAVESVPDQSRGEDETVAPSETGVVELPSTGAGRSLASGDWRWSAMVVVISIAMLAVVAVVVSAWTQRHRR